MSNLPPHGRKYLPPDAMVTWRRPDRKRHKPTRQRHKALRAASRLLPAPDVLLETLAEARAQQQGDEEDE